MISGSGRSSEDRHLTGIGPRVLLGCFVSRFLSAPYGPDIRLKSVLVVQIPCRWSRSSVNLIGKCMSQKKSKVFLLKASLKESRSTSKFPSGSGRVAPRTFRRSYTSAWFNSLVARLLREEVIWPNRSSMIFVHLRMWWPAICSSVGHRWLSWCECKTGTKVDRRLFEGFCVGTRELLCLVTDEDGRCEVVEVAPCVCLPQLQFYLRLPDGVE